MQPASQPQLLDLPLPLMTIAPHHALSVAYLHADSLERFEAIRSALAGLGVTLALLYTYQDATQQPGYSGVLVLDHTNAHEPPDRVAAALGQVTGVDVRATQPPGSGLVGLEKDHLSVAGTPVVVMARPFLGETHKLLLESVGDQAAGLLLRAGEAAGKMAASGVPALVGTLGLQLSPQLIRQRFYDLQVFGWATVVALQVNDQFVGEALLADDFEAAAWHGQATTSVCHWIRGFLTGALSSLTGHALTVSEPECQATGDQYCRMVMQAR